MDKKRILVTGGAGFIGSHTVVELLENGYTPILADDFSNSQRSVLGGLEKVCGRALTCHEVDCRDRAALSHVFAQEEPIAGVIHFAASKAVSESQERPLHYYSNNVGSLLTLLEVMREHEVGDLVFSSSCTVYGQPDELPVTEETKLAPPASVYGATKQICERILQDVVASGAPLRAMLLRYFNPIGAHPGGEIGELPLGNPQNLVPIIVQSAAGLRGPVHIFGGDWATPDGSCIRDYIHVVDLASAHVKSLDWMSGLPDEPRVTVLNVGTGAGVSVRQALAAFEDATGQKVEATVAARRPGDVEQVYANVERAERVLGWRAQRSIEDAMRDAWRWQRTLLRSSGRSSAG